MRKIIYQIAKLCMRAALYCYFGNIKVHNQQAIPKSGALMLLPNHQNALLDALLIAINSNRKPYFLTRSDVFSNTLFRSLFHFFRMLPVYRMRDGRETLNKNEAIFQRCTELLSKGEAVVIFPEANHNLVRRVRPLSKGFTRILFQTIEQNHDLEILLMPVGMNYYRAAAFPDLASVYYGKPFPLSTLYDPDDLRNAIIRIKGAVSDQLKILTTHIAEEEAYEQIVTYLKNRGVKFQDPGIANQAARDLALKDLKTEPVKQTHPKTPLNILFYLLNFPMVIPWLWIKRNHIPEQEFTSTFRFAYALLVYPLFYLLAFLFLGSEIGYAPALICIAFHFGANQLYIKSIQL
ncbi:MAG: lysophospholipid acyltransferase family protein [Eudoraea sp.]|nr:lysophospholipid acyltransferase family protein [Eudoraea sp.]NNK30320.1 glycerol acyltransferase [Flavobacteriaceae bacterium]